MKSGFETVAGLITALLGKRPGGAAPFEPDENYGEFLKNNQPDGAALQAQRGQPPEYGPLFCVLSLGKGEPDLRDQSYEKWELGENGVIKGQYVVLMGGGDRLAPDALYTFACAVSGEDPPDFVYADEDRMENGERTGADFKPDFSMLTLLSYNFVGRPLAVSRELYRQSGGLAGSRPAEEYDFVLRCAALCKRPLHIPRVLLTRDARPQPPDPVAAREAIATQLMQDTFQASVEEGLVSGTFRVRIGVGRPEVGIVIPNRDGQENLRELLENIDDNALYRHYRVVIADYGSREERTLKYYDILEKNKAASVVRLNAYNYSRLCNRGAFRAGSDVLLFLDPGVRARSPDWLLAMLEQTRRPGVGAVGPKLIDPSGKLISCGTVVGLGGGLHSPYEKQPSDLHDERRDRFVNTLRAVSALCGKCIMMDADVFFGAGGFDESFKVSGADTELCLRLQRRGLANVYTPFATLVYREGRLPPVPKQDTVRIYDAIRPMLFQGDPRYNPNFDYAQIVPKPAVQPYPALDLFQDKP